MPNFNLFNPSSNVGIVPDAKKDTAEEKNFDFSDFDAPKPLNPPDFKRSASPDF